MVKTAADDECIDIQTLYAKDYLIDEDGESHHSSLFILLREQAKGTGKNKVENTWMERMKERCLT